MVMVRRRRPVLRAAAVGGGAYALGSRRAQAGRDTAGEDVPAAAAAEGSAPQSGMPAADLQRLRELAELNRQGVITDEEMAEQKARILG